MVLPGDMPLGPSLAIPGVMAPMERGFEDCFGQKNPSRSKEASSSPLAIILVEGSFAACYKMRMRSQDGSVRILLVDDEAEDGLIAIEKMGEFATRYCDYGYSHTARERHSSPKTHLYLLSHLRRSLYRQRSIHQNRDGEMKPCKHFPITELRTITTIVPS
jgi:hypothetical protein